MAFVKFDNVGAKLSNIISLTKSESFGFAAGFYNKYNISQFNYVTLFYDKEDAKIGFQFSKEKQGKSTFKIIHGDNRESGSVIARSFFRTFNINKDKYQGRYTPFEIEDPQFGKMFCIKISEGMK